MSWPKILVYYVVAASLMTYVYSVEGDRFKPEVPAESMLAPLLEGPASRVAELDIAGKGLRLSLRRVDGRWRLVSPAGLSLTSDLIDALLETLSEISPIEVVSKSGADLATFGLQPPEWVLVATGDKGRRVIDLGYRSPTSTALYAKTDEAPEVLLVGLNAQYYVDLISQEVDGQIAASGLRP